MKEEQLFQFVKYKTMTREEIKRRAELYSALADGKTIQILNMEGNWVDVEVKKLNYIPETLKFRIKPEPKYRPFKTQEECWNEMLKHQPFGWLKSIKKQEKVHIGRIFDTPDVVFITLSINEGLNYSSSYLFEEYTFDDGTLFGIEEE